jgi:RNA polymerase sigma factor (sigma-70 family)
MDQGKGQGRARGRGRSKAAEELILRVVAAHADSLLRTARRHSICPDDAQDAYQSALEIFMARADRLDPERVAGWLHVVVKREAQAICRSRTKLVSASDPGVDEHESRRLSSPEDRILSTDLVGRAAEALQRLKPQELRAVWLKAEGHSYNEIAAITGWSYTKVNRCLTEGRRSFLDRFAAIETGAECERWLPIISAMVDGEADAVQILELRPHLRNCPACRATLKALRDSSAPLSAVLPVPLAVVCNDGGEQLSNVFMRAYEMVAGGVHERVVYSATKAQATLEAATSGKIAAVAASAAAAAGGGYATVERTVTRSHVDRGSKTARQAPKQSASKPPSRSAAAARAPAAAPLQERPIARPAQKPNKGHAIAKSTPASEFDPTPGAEPLRAASASAGVGATASGRASTRSSPTSATSAHERSSAPSAASAPVQYGSSSEAGEFGP